VSFLSEPILLIAILEVLVGIALLTTAADKFVDGAAGVAGHARMSPVLVGAVVVGFGTSAPELLVSGIAAARGDLDLGVGNIVGSNVANLTLVLGSAALIVPLIVSRPVLIREAPLSLLSVLAFAYVTIGGLQRWEGIALLLGLVAALSWVIAGGVDHDPAQLGPRQPRGPSTLSAAAAADPTPAPSTPNPDGTEAGTFGSHAIRTVLGLIGTVAGAQLLVWGAQAIAAGAGLTGGFVGFTLVAVGTSLPELVTAVMAARRGATDLLLGNLLGSNMFNSLAVGGVIAVLGPGMIQDEGLRTIGVGVMVAVALGAWFAMATLRRVHRVEAIALLTSWFVAVVLLAQTATAP
jgi:cation:H+ antiporter